MRATAKLADDAVVADDATLTELVNRNGGGRFVITLDPEGQDARPASLPGHRAAGRRARSRRSSRTTCCVPSSSTPGCGWRRTTRCRAACCCKSCRASAAYQRAVGRHAGTWERTVMLASTLKQDELLTTDIQTLMRRLFWEETIRVFDPLHPRFHCSCKREKVGNMLKMLGQEEIDSAIAELGHAGHRLRLLRPALRLRQGRLRAAVCRRRSRWMRCRRRGRAGTDPARSPRQARIETGLTVLQQSSPAPCAGFFYGNTGT